MTAPAPKYRYLYAIPLRHDVIRGSVKARTESDARAILALEYGAEMAEQATITLAAVEVET